MVGLGGTSPISISHLQASCKMGSPSIPENFFLFSKNAMCDLCCGGSLLLSVGCVAWHSLTREKRRFLPFSVMPYLAACSRVLAALLPRLTINTFLQLVFSLR